MLAISLYATAAFAAPPALPGLPGLSTSTSTSTFKTAPLPQTLLGTSTTTGTPASTGVAVSTKAAVALERRKALGPRALGILKLAVRHEDADIRVLAYEQWGTMGEPSLIPLIKNGLKDPNPNVRIAAAGSLYMLDDKSGVPVVEKIAAVKLPPKKNTKGKESPLSDIEALKRDVGNRARANAIKTLGRMAERSSIELIIKAKEDPDGQVRDTAFAALARLGGDDELKFLTASLSSPDKDVRLSAAKALVEVGTGDGLEDLIKAAKDPASEVRAAVMEALGATGEIGAIPALRAGAKDGTDLVRSKAVAGLCRIPDPTGEPALRDAAKGTDNVFIQLLALAGLLRVGDKVDLNVLQRALAQKDSDTRMLAVEVLEASGGDAAIEKLDFALDDAEMRVRVRAAAALVKLLRRPS